MKGNQDQIYDMSIKQTETAARQAVIQQRFHPGFQCFFKEYLNNKAMSFNQCLSDLIRGSRSIEEIKLSLPNILNMKGTSVADKSKMIGIKEHRYIYFYKDQNQNNRLTSKLLDETFQGDQNVHRLQRNLLVCRENKEKLLNKKVQQLKKKKQDIAPPQNMSLAEKQSSKVA